LLPVFLPVFFVSCFDTIEREELNHTRGKTIWNSI
jgi:hypothetical protein